MRFKLTYFRRLKEQPPSALTAFRNRRNLILNGETAVSDFDAKPANPIDYKDALNKRNLLNTACSGLNEEFTGNGDKYTYVYNYLFSCNFAKEPLPPLYKIPDEYFRLIKEVFAGQDIISDKIRYYNGT